MQFASKLGRVLCRTRLFFSRTNGPNLSVRSLESSAYPYERPPWFQMLSSPATRWASNQLIRRKTASSFLFFFWDTVDFRRARLLRKRTTARGLIRRMGLGRGTFFIQFISLPPLTNVKSLPASSLHDDELRAQHLWTFSKSNAYVSRLFMTGGPFYLDKTSG